MSNALLPLAEAAGFTLGCAAIHALRRHADAVTATLACFATILILVIGLACAPPTDARRGDGTAEQTAWLARIEPPTY